MQREGRRQEAENCQGWDASQSISFSRAALRLFFCTALRSFIRRRSEARGEPRVRISRFFSGLWSRWRRCGNRSITISSRPHRTLRFRMPASSPPQTRYASHPVSSACPGDTRIIPDAAHFYCVPVVCEFTAHCLYRIVGKLSAWFILKVARFQEKITFAGPVNFV